MGFEKGEFPAVFFRKPGNPIAEAVMAVLKEFSRKHLVVELRKAESPGEYDIEFISLFQAIGIASIRHGA